MNTRYLLLITPLLFACDPDRDDVETIPLLPEPTDATYEAASETVYEWPYEDPLSGVDEGFAHCDIADEFVDGRCEVEDSGTTAVVTWVAQDYIPANEYHSGGWHCAHTITKAESDTTTVSTIAVCRCVGSMIDVCR